MNEKSLRAALQDLPLGELRYYASIRSTNDEALAWATEGATDLSLVIADEQTAGRGRAGRKWYTPAGAALAFSLILRPSPAEQTHLSRIVGLAAVSLAFSLEQSGLHPRIKWPNDILLQDRKVAGILVETIWTGEQADCVVIGIGVNVLRIS
ncbi:MAG: biotin--[acetyl-CoA-carboxylase] ligase, partial [Anaerolineae bacterium]